MPLFISKEEKEKRRQEKGRIKEEKRRLNRERVIREGEQARLEIAESKAALAERNAMRQKEIDEIDARLEKTKAHNRKVLSKWADEVIEIKQDFIQEQRNISARHCNRND